MAPLSKRTRGGIKQPTSFNPEATSSPDEPFSPAKKAKIIEGEGGEQAQQADGQEEDADLPEEVWEDAKDLWERAMEAAGGQYIVVKVSSSFPSKRKSQRRKRRLTFLLPPSLPSCFFALPSPPHRVRPLSSHPPLPRNRSRVRPHPQERRGPVKTPSILLFRILDERAGPRPRLLASVLPHLR